MGAGARRVLCRGEMSQLASVCAAYVGDVTIPTSLYGAFRLRHRWFNPRSGTAVIVYEVFVLPWIVVICPTCHVAGALNSSHKPHEELSVWRTGIIRCSSIREKLGVIMPLPVALCETMLLESVVVMIGFMTMESVDVVHDQRQSCNYAITVSLTST
jgi:hypothetical protein